MTLEFPQTTRRSALEATHAALGARWISEAVHWPVGYFPPPAADETAAVTTGAGLAEIGPLDEWLLRGPDSLGAASRLMGDVLWSVGRVVGIRSDEEHGEAWILGPDEVLLLCPTGGLASRSIANLASANVSIVAMTGARAALRIAGSAAPAVLADSCAVDTTPNTLRVDQLIQASLVGVRVLLARQDTGRLPGYTILVARDEATYLWDTLLDVGASHGLTPVGPASVATSHYP